MEPEVILSKQDKREIYDLIGKNTVQSLVGDAELLHKIRDVAKTLGDFSLAQRSDVAAACLTFAYEYFTTQNGLEKDLEQIAIAERPAQTFAQKTNQFKFDGGFEELLAEVILGKRTPRNAADACKGLFSTHETDYRPILFATIHLLGCTPNVVLPRLAYLAAYELLKSTIILIPESESTKEILQHLSAHAIGYANAVLSTEKDINTEDQ